MIFSRETMKVGGKVVIPDSFVNNKDEGTITEVNGAGIMVAYEKHGNKQTSFYSYSWLNQQYGSQGASGDGKRPASEGDVKLDDPIPF